MRHGYHEFCLVSLYLLIECRRLRQDLCRLLVKQCNVDKRSITVHRMEYKFTPETFTSVMGVGDRGTPIVLGGEDSEITNLRANR